MNHYRQKILDLPHPYRDGSIEIYRNKKSATSTQAFDEVEIYINYMTPDGPTRLAVPLSIGEARLISDALTVAAK